MNDYYIYTYLDPRKPGQYCYNDICFLFEPIYVGKGKDKRYKIYYKRNPIFKNKTNKIKKLGLKPMIFKLYENLNEEESFKLETKLIKEIGRTDLGTGSLLNMTDGGEGSSRRIISEETLKKLRKNFQYINQIFERRNYKLLTEEKDYKNANDTKLKYICQNGHECYIRLNHFQQGQSCPYCAKLKINFSDIKKEFKKRNYILSVEEKDYKNNRQKLKYICQNGHECYISWSNFQKGKGCKICYKEKRRKKIKESNGNLTNRVI